MGCLQMAIIYIVYDAFLITIYFSFFLFLFLSIISCYTVQFLRLLGFFLLLQLVVN